VEVPDFYPSCADYPTIIRARGAEKIYLRKLFLFMEQLLIGTATSATLAYLPHPQGISVAHHLPHPLQSATDADC